MTLVEFLTARLDEDEDAYVEVNRYYKNRGWTLSADGRTLFDDGGSPVYDHFSETPEPAVAFGRFVIQFAPLRIREECKAKRQIIERAHVTMSYGCGACGAASYGGDIVAHEQECNGDPAYLLAESTLRLLASVYADHPDYREEWRP